MIYKANITVSTIAKEGQKYPIFKDQTYNLGNATFLNKEDSLFVFEIALFEETPENYKYMFDVDINTLELASLRAVEI